jgi:hypothetical protein
MVRPGTSMAIGCFHMIHSTWRYEQSIRREAVGSTVCPVQVLLGGGFDANRLRRADALLERPEDAWEAFLRARKVLDLPARASLPREKIEQLIAKIQEQ